MTETNSPPPLRLTLLTLGSDDLERATAFYEALGLVRSSASNDGVSFFDAGGAVLSVYGRAALAEDAGLDPRGEGFRAQSLAWNVGSEAQVDDAIGRMVAAGGGLVKAAEKTFWGGYAGYATDPEGHLWEVAHNPGFPVAADGRVRLP